MLSELLDFILGLVLTVVLVRLCCDFWFLPSPFNSSLLESLLSEDDNNSLKSFLASLTFVLTSFILQMTIPLGCVTLKRFLTSQLSILDVLIICTTPAICLFCLNLVSLWTYYIGNQKVEFNTHLGSSDKGFKPKYSSLTKKDKDFLLEWSDVNPLRDLPILIREVFPIIGLLAICLSGGLIGYLLDGRLG
jgi:hypothetical protein